ncbi:MAG: hypothetical protein ACJ8AI_14315 [Rhodopila sp.]
MEPISAIVTALALGAAAAAKEVGGEVVKDAYGALKAFIVSRYPKTSVDSLEAAPESERRRGVVEEDLQAAHAAGDVELAALARKLVELIRQQAPGAAAAIGVDLKDVEAVNLRLADITASGTGVKVEHGRFSGDISISGVRAGGQSDPAPKG